MDIKIVQMNIKIVQMNLKYSSNEIIQMEKNSSNENDIKQLK